MEKGDKQTKKTRSLHKSETEVITRRRAFALLALKNFVVRATFTFIRLNCSDRIVSEISKLFVLCI